MESRRRGRILFRSFIHVRRKRKRSALQNGWDIRGRREIIFYEICKRTDYPEGTPSEQICTQLRSSCVVYFSPRFSPFCFQIRNFSRSFFRVISVLQSINSSAAISSNPP